MILKQQHPDDPTVQVYVLFWYDDADDTWFPLYRDDVYFESEADAGRKYMQHLYELWSDIEHEVRLLRALCEHPNFDFADDGIDSVLILERAQKLAELVDRSSVAFTRALTPPLDDDIIDNAWLEKNGGAS